MGYTVNNKLISFWVCKTTSQLCLFYKEHMISFVGGARQQRFIYLRVTSQTSYLSEGYKANKLISLDLHSNEVIVCVGYTAYNKLACLRVYTTISQLCSGYMEHMISTFGVYGNNTLSIFGLQGTQVTFQRGTWQANSFS